jgi:hypothetical protein
MHIFKDVHYMLMRRHTAVFKREADRMFAGRSGATEKASAPIACTIHIKSSYLDLQGEIKNASFCTPAFVDLSYHLLLLSLHLSH